MPYIEPERREEYDTLIEALDSRLEDMGREAGDLNYVISRLCGLMWKGEPRYKTICFVIGTLVCVAFEFYRRVAGGYEDLAIKKNGDLKEYKENRRWLTWKQ